MFKTIKGIIESKQTSSLVDKSNSFVTNPSYGLSEKYLAQLYESRPKQSEFIIDVKPGTRDAVAVSVVTSKSCTLDKLSKRELLGAYMTSLCIMAFGNPFDAAAAIIAQHYAAVKDARSKTQRQYKIQQKERRDQANKSGQPLRLAFLWSILDARGLTTDAAIGQAYDTTAQAISYIKKFDDIKISNLVRMLEAVNLNVGFSFEGLIKTPTNSSAFKVVCHFRLRNNPPKYAYMCQEDGGRLSFLVKTVKKSGLPLRRFCNRYNLSYQFMYGVLKRDDISLSALEAIGEAIGHPLRMDIFES